MTCFFINYIFLFFDHGFKHGFEHDFKHDFEHDFKHVFEHDFKHDFKHELVREVDEFRLNKTLASVSILPVFQDSS